MPEPNRHWSVCSPEFGEVVPVLDDGSGPMEYGCDYAEVIAPTKRAAVALAVRAWRHNLRSHSDYTGENVIDGVLEAYGQLKWCDSGNENPFRGLRVALIEPCGSHGYEFEECGDECYQHSLLEVRG